MSNPPPILSYAGPTAPEPSRRWGIFGWVLFIGLAVMLFMLVQKKDAVYTQIALSDFESELESGTVRRVVIDSDGVHGTFIRPQSMASNGAIVTNFRAAGPRGADENWSFIQSIEARRQGATVEVYHDDNVLRDLLIPLILWLLIFGFIWFFVFRNLRKNQRVEPRPIPVYQVPPPVPGGVSR